MTDPTMIKPGIWLNSIDVAAEFASIELSTSNSLVDVTPLTSAFVERAVARRDFGISVSAFVDDSAAVAKVLASEMDAISAGAISAGVWTLVPTPNAPIGAAAYLGRADKGSASLAGSIGDAQRLDFWAEGEGRLLRGALLARETIDSASARTGESSWTEIGAAGDREDLRVHVHVLSRTGSPKLRIRRSAASTGSNPANVLAQTTFGPNTPFSQSIDVSAGFSETGRIWLAWDWELGSDTDEMDIVIAAAR